MKKLLNKLNIEKQFKKFTQIVAATKKTVEPKEKYNATSEGVDLLKEEKSLTQLCEELELLFPSKNLYEDLKQIIAKLESDTVPAIVSKENPIKIIRFDSSQQVLKLVLPRDQFLIAAGKGHYILVLYDDETSKQYAKVMTTTPMEGVNKISDFDVEGKSVAQYVRPEIYDETLLKIHKEQNLNVAKSYKLQLLLKKIKNFWLVLLKK